MTTTKKTKAPTTPEEFHAQMAANREAAFKEMHPQDAKLEKGHPLLEKGAMANWTRSRMRENFPKMSKDEVERAVAARCRKLYDKPNGFNEFGERVGKNQ